VFGLAFLGWVLECVAEVPLLYAGDVEVAVHRAAADSGVAVWELDPVRISDMLPEGVPVIVGAGARPGCDGKPATNLELRESVARIEGRVSYQQFPEAARELKAAKAAFTCLAEPAEASLGARLFFLDGLHAQLTDDVALARAAFERALLFSPALRWDESYPPEQRALFDAAVAAHGRFPRANLLVVGGAGESTLSVDGRVTRVDTAVSLPVGIHLIQVLEPDVSTFEEQIHPSVATALVLPGHIADATVEQAGDPAGQRLLTAFVEHADVDAPEAYVWSGTETWRVTDAWEPLSPQRTSWKTRADMRSDRLLWGGGAAAVTGAATMGVGAALYFSNQRPPVDGVESQTDFENRTVAGGAGLGLLYSGLAAVAVGAGSMGVAIIWRIP
jgi:hypothetical protein